MSDGGGDGPFDTQWGNGQPGNERFDPNYGTAQQAPTQYLGGPPGDFLGLTYQPENTQGNYFVSSAMPQGAGGYNYGDNNPSSSAINPITSSGGFTPPPGTGGGFDEAGFAGIDFSNLNLGGIQSSGLGAAAMPPSTSSFDELGFTLPGATTAPAAGPGAASVAGLPGIDPNIDPNNPSNAAYGSNPQTPYGTRNPAYGEETLPTVSGGGGSNTVRGGAAPAGGGDAAGGLLNSLGIKNPVGTALAAGGLAYNAITGSQQRESTKTIEQQAAMLNENGKQLMSYLQGGNLPPGLKASLEQATAAAKAKVIQNFASQGMNPDPTKNSALAAQLAAIDQQAIITTAQIGQQLMSTGVQQSGMASDLYKTLANIDATQTANIGKSIAAMAAALNGNGQGMNIRFG